MSRYLIVAGIFYTSRIFGLVDVGLEGGYLSGKMTTYLTSGNSTGVNFTGYVLRPSLLISTDLGAFHLGIGPALTFPFIRYDSVPSTWISNQINIVRYGGELNARWKITSFIQPFLRFEMGKDAITESLSSYPTITSGPTAGTVDYSRVAEVRYSYGSLYFVLGGGIYIQIFQKISGFLLLAYTTGTANQINLESITVNGVAQSNVTNNFSSNTYKAFHLNLGISYAY